VALGLPALPHRHAHAFFSRLGKNDDTTTDASGHLYVDAHVITPPSSEGRKEKARLHAALGGRAGSERGSILPQ